MAAKKLKDYLPKVEDKTETFAVRISAEMKRQIEQKMAKEGIKKQQQLGEALLRRFLDE